jgi:hypothetical protein
MAKELRGERRAERDASCIKAYAEQLVDSGGTLQFIFYCAYLRHESMSKDASRKKTGEQNTEEYFHVFASCPTHPLVKYPDVWHPSE